MLFSLNSLVTSFVLALYYFKASEAHVTLATKYAEPGQTNFSTAFHVPHGCNGSSTTSIYVTVPQEITTLTPQAVANWTLSTTYRDSTNTSIETITWAGGFLSPTSSLDFPIVLNVPNEDLSSRSNVTLFFPTVQTCEVGSTAWTTTNGSNVGEPAPSLVIVKNATAAASSAIAMTSTAAHTAAASATGTNTSGASVVLASLLPLVAAVGAAFINF